MYDVARESSRYRPYTSAKGWVGKVCLHLEQQSVGLVGCFNPVSPNLGIPRRIFANDRREDKMVGEGKALAVVAVGVAEGMSSLMKGRWERFWLACWTK
jgi:hypothetical protein